MRKLLPLLLACLIGTPLTLQAGIVEHDFEAQGDGLLTYDTVNRREWLDMPETGGVLLSEVLMQMAPGGRLEGFEFATLADVSALAESAGVSWQTLTLPGLPDDDIDGFVESLGWVIRLSGGILPDLEIVLGLIADDITPSGPVFADTNFYAWTMLFADDLIPGEINRPLYLNFSPTGGVYSEGPFDVTFYPGLPPMGTGDIGPFWLYRAVPEPHSVALLLVSCIAAFVQRCRNAQLR